MGRWLSLDLSSPQILGPLGALVLALLLIGAFLSETVVSGRAYHRLQDQNEQLRKLLDKAVDVSERLQRKDEEQTDKLWDLASRSQSVSAEARSVERSIRSPRRGQG